MYINDTIAAVATPSGRGGIGIVRVSGSRALEVMHNLFRGKQNVEHPEPNRLYYGSIIDLKSNIIDTGYAVFMKAPYSYTGENTVEFHVHGSPAVLSRILLVLNEIGIRTAEPGEFTRRAFLNGKMDLLQAEAVLDLVNASTEIASRLALSQLKGDLSKRIEGLKNSIINIVSKIDAEIDFPESVDEEMNREEILSALTVIKKEIDNLISSYRVGRVFREGLLFLITGKPNAGKSSIFNAILGKERAIVHKEPGTTRDYIEEEIFLNGNPIRLVDSAGIWNADDEVEGMGIRKALEIFENADAFILVIDASEGITRDDLSLIEKLENREGIIVLNKCDLQEKVNEGEIKNLLPGWKITKTSAIKGTGIESLKDTISSLSLELIPAFEGGIITRARHFECLKSTLRCVENTEKYIKNGADLVIISDEMRRALRALAELVGQELNEAVLDKIFSEFCIGK